MKRSSYIINIMAVVTVIALLAAVQSVFAYSIDTYPEKFVIVSSPQLSKVSYARWSMAGALTKMNPLIEGASLLDQPRGVCVDMGRSRLWAYIWCHVRFFLNMRSHSWSYSFTKKWDVQIWYFWLLDYSYTIHSEHYVCYILKVRLWRWCCVS